MRKEIEPATIEKVVIRGLNWRLGDSLMTTPFIAACRALFPRATIDLIIPPRVARVFEGNPHISSVIFFDAHGTHKSLMSRYRFAKELRAKGYDVALLLQRALEAALITWAAKIPVRVGYDSDARGFFLTHPVSEKGWTLANDEFHQVEYYLNMLRAHFTLPEGPFPLSIYPLAEDAKTLLGKLPPDFDFTHTPYMVVAPGTSYGEAKLWDIERWKEAIARVRIAFPAYRVVLVGAEHDVAYCRALENEEGVINVVGKTSVGELIQLIDRARVVLTIDSGTSHLAAARARPMVALFGSTNPVTTAPYGKEDDVIYHGAPCSPCHDTRCRKEDHACMKAITVDEVVDAVVRRIGE